MTETNSFVPETNIRYVGANVFWLFLVLFVILVISYATYVLYIKKSTGYGPIKPSYEANLVSDTITHDTIPNKDLECPSNSERYSFTFFLEIKDFYCNRGYWKCIMIKGSPITNKINKCTESIPSKQTFTLGESCQTRNKEIYNCKSDIKCETLKEKLKEPIVLNQKDNSEDLFKRLDVICRGLELGKAGKDMVCDSAANCGLFLKSSSGAPAETDTFPIRKGVCDNFLEKHRDYCDKVYAIDKKVARVAEEERIQSIKLKDTKGQFQEANKDRKFDDYDNICSADNFLQEYPHLIPRNIEELKEADLINHAEKTRLDVAHSVNSAFNLEGCYLKTKLDELDKVKISINTEDTKTVILDKCNREAEKLGFEYFGITLNGGVEECMAFREEDIKNNVNLREDKNKCSTRLGSVSYYYISKVKVPGETIVKDCWKDIIESYPYQNPGVWLHPFTNSMRIVFTTNSEKPYSAFVNDYFHANTGNPSNHEVQQVEYIPPEHPGVENASPTDYYGGCQIGIVPKTNNYYREFFDINNIPIMEEFHLSLVINESSVDVYINGKQNTTVPLFGKPTYNQGSLQINPGSVKLGGVVRQFKYFPYSIDTSNIVKMMLDRRANQYIGGDPILVPKEHGHQISISHDHEYHPNEEGYHKHSVGDEDISKSYY